MSVHVWRSLSWPAFRALQSDRLLAILPLGALEAHGPHLPLGTDLVIAEAMASAGAQLLSRRGFDVVVLPALPVSPAPFAASFAGTIDTPPAATTALVAGIAESAARHGALATVVANSHHDPAHVEAIRAAVRRVEARGLATIVFPDLTRRRWAARLTEEFRSGACHAGRYEGSVVLAAEPRLVDVGLLPTLTANPRSLVDAIRRGDRTFADAGGPDAYFGSPADATAEEGREIIERLGAIVEDSVVEIMEELRTKNEERRTERRTQNEEPNEERNEERPEERPDERNEERPEELPGVLDIVNPERLGRPRGFSHGIAVPAGWRTLHVAGQTAAAGPDQVVIGDFAEQFGRALGRVLEVIRAAGGNPSSVARMTIYVTDIDAYRERRVRLGAIWSEQMGRHYPAMALVEVTALVDTGALVEIQADAALPPPARASSVPR
jgi:creatinine amidohydrolase